MLKGEKYNLTTDIGSIKDQHQNNHKHQIELFLCLGDCCKGKRVYCKRCSQYKDQQHKMIRLKAAKENLKKNKQKQKKQKFQERWNILEKAFQGFDKGVQSIRKYKQDTLKPSFLAIIGSFDQKLAQIAENCSKVLALNPNNEQHKTKLQEIVSILKIHDTIKIQQIDSLDKSTQKLTDELIDLFKKITNNFELMPLKTFKTQKFQQQQSTKIIQNKTIKQIYQQILKIKTIKNLSILSDDRQCSINNQILYQIIKLKNLQKLQIKWGSALGVQDLKKFFSKASFKDNLKQIHIQNCKNAMECTQQIIQNFKKLQNFSYSINNLTSLQKMNEDKHFLFKPNTEKSLEFKQLQKLSKINKLQSLWLGDWSNSQSAFKIISEMKFLNNLTLGQFDRKQRQISKTILNVLKSHQLFISLSLIRITNFHNLGEIFQKNPQLDTLLIHDCYIINKQIMNNIKNSCLKLRQLSIPYSIIENILPIIAEMKNLQTLILNSVDLQNPSLKKSVIFNVYQLSKLSFLDLGHNTWIKDQIFEGIANLKQLKHLNIESTSISSTGFLKLGNSNLETLICGDNKITGKDIRVVAEQLPKLRKLGLSYSRKQYLNDRDLKEIGLIKDKDITHLNIQGCKQLTHQIIDFFKKLKCIKITNSGVDPNKIKKFDLYILN